MPTALDIAKRVKMVRPDTCTITLAKGQELLAPAAGEPRQRAAIEIDWLKPGETKSVKWQVKGAGTDQGRRGLDPRRTGFEGNRTEMSYAFFFLICSSRPPSAYFT